MLKLLAAPKLNADEPVWFAFWPAGFEVRLEVRAEAGPEFMLGFRLNLKPALPPPKLLFSSGLLVEVSRGFVSFGLSLAPR